MSDEWIEKGLVAEAARQRQLETVNFRLKKLDFDGVEPELGMHLLSLHWNRQHHSFLTTYRPAFMRDMACGGPYFSKLLLNAIYFGASKFSPRHEVRRAADDVRTAGWQFRERVRELLGGALDKSEITTIQALLVMTNSLFALGDERSAAWLYAGLAFRMIVDLGLHVDKPEFAGYRKLSDEDHEIRRRVFWAAFVVDKIQSLYQGRPVSMTDTLVPTKFLDTYEELEHWTPFSYSTQPDAVYLGSPAYSISTFRHLCQLSVILSDILSTIYTERSFDLLRAYDKTFSVRRAPYLISYATYVAATVHARIAAKRGAGSQAHKSLETCLAVFRDNQETNWAVRRANAIIQSLMKRLGVVAPELNDIHIGSGEDNHSSAPDVSLGSAMDREPSLQSFDIDGIIQSFVRDQDSTHPAQPGSMDPTAELAVPGVPPSAYSTTETANLPFGNSGDWTYQGQQQTFSEQPFSVDDLLYGFNGSELDQFTMLDWDM
ncbi:hypothetical protein J4E83_005063 [Alternaria metachromatica]|uniref:uncharacterized protein n=1 Tax=Alternaria metachromatica TaxID=283354 RepID=UPI0020C35774|nr:uncharacterized protein J4E83_005063 [Alternaria metachromatica]KAI4622321.1 hypothetical protein J4E83_005063 [Alternaria metachromatica]